MARRDALLRLHKTLVGRRSDLLRRLGVDLSDLGQARQGNEGDSADAAFDSGSDEIASQLAELEARELHQIQRALARLKQGTYGVCEICQSKIPVARLNALPYSTMCIKCQRDLESDISGFGSGRLADWDKVSDVESRSENRREVDISDLEMDLSK
jgi:DnaK suppressor protein